MILQGLDAVRIAPAPLSLKDSMSSDVSTEPTIGVLLVRRVFSAVLDELAVFVFAELHHDPIGADAGAFAGDREAD